VYVSALSYISTEHVCFGFMYTFLQVLIKSPEVYLWAGLVGNGLIALTYNEPEVEGPDSRKSKFESWTVKGLGREIIHSYCVMQINSCV